MRWMGGKDGSPWASKENNFDFDLPPKHRVSSALYSPLSPPPPPHSLCVRKAPADLHCRRLPPVRCRAERRCRRQTAGLEPSTQKYNIKYPTNTSAIWGKVNPTAKKGGESKVAIYCHATLISRGWRILRTRWHLLSQDKEFKKKEWPIVLFVWFRPRGVAHHSASGHHRTLLQDPTTRGSVKVRGSTPSIQACAIGQKR